MTGREYTCDRCGGTYLSDRAEEEAQAEAVDLFEGITFGGRATGVLCEDCWQEFMKWMLATYGPPPWPAMN